MKKVILSVVVTIMLLSGCSIGRNQELDPYTNLEVVYDQFSYETLDLYLTCSPYVNYGLTDLEYCSEIFSRRCEEIMNTKINIHFLPPVQMYDEELKSAFDAGLPIDIFLGVDGMVYGLGEKPVEKWVDMGVAANITDLIDINYPSARINIDKYKDKVGRNGSIYGIPIVFKNTSAYGMWMSADLSKEFEKLSCFQDVLRVYEVAMNNDIPIYVDLSSIYNLWAADQGYYRDSSFIIDQYKHEVYPIEETELFPDLYDFMLAYYQYPSTKNYESIDCVKVVSYDSLRTYNDPLSQKYIRSDNNYVLRLIDIEDSYINRERVRGVIIISETSTKKERALMFLDIVYNNEELSKLLLYGVEGTSYKINDKGFLIESKVGLWGDTIANMKYDDLTYEFDLDYPRYLEVKEDDRIGNYRNSQWSIYDKLMDEELLVYNNRAYINWVDRQKKLFTENSIFEIIADLKKENPNALEDTIAKYLWD